MVRRSGLTLALLVLIGLSACAPADPLIGTWHQTGAVAADGAVRSVPPSQAVVLTLRRDGRARVTLPGSNTEGAPFTWSVDRGLLVLRDHPGWEVRTAYELVYQLEGDRLTTDWIGGPPRRVFTRQ